MVIRTLAESLCTCFVYKEKRFDDGRRVSIRVF